MLSPLDGGRLSELAALDSEAGASWLDGAIPAGDLRRVLGPAIAQQRVVLGITIAVGAIGATEIINLAFQMDRSRELFSLNLLAPFVFALLPWLAIYASVVAPGFLGAKNLRASLAESGMVAFFVGPSPYTRRLLVLGRRRLFLVGAGGIQFAVRYEDVSAVGIESRVAGLLVALCVGDSIVPLSVPGRVGGPFSLRWSFDGIIGVGRLQRELCQWLEMQDVPVALIDLSHQPQQGESN